MENNGLYHVGLACEETLESWSDARAEQEKLVGPADAVNGRPNASGNWLLNIWFIICNIASDSSDFSKRRDTVGGEDASSLTNPPFKLRSWISKQVLKLIFTNSTNRRTVTRLAMHGTFNLAGETCNLGSGYPLALWQLLDIDFSPISSRTDSLSVIVVTTRCLHEPRRPYG